MSTEGGSRTTTIPNVPSNIGPKPSGVKGKVECKVICHILFARFSIDGKDLWQLEVTCVYCDAHTLQPCHRHVLVLLYRCLHSSLLRGSSSQCASVGSK
eukprot:6487078-Amphidinium_carterae.2